jgi:predicted Zn finger-like uncharacterized protein
MTVEQRTLIPLVDIMSIEFECDHCHATYSIPLSELKAAETSLSCINCPQQFADSHYTDSSKMTDLQILQGFLTRLREIQQRKYKASIRLVLPIKKSSECGASRDSGEDT